MISEWGLTATDSAPTEPDRDANPVPGKFGLAALYPDEVFSDGERVFPFRLDAFVEPPGLLFVCGVEFDVGVTLEELLEPVILMVKYLSLDVCQPHDLRPNDLLYLHHVHQLLLRPRPQATFGHPPPKVFASCFICALQKHAPLGHLANFMAFSVHYLLDAKHRKYSRRRSHPRFEKRGFPAAVLIKTRFFVI